MWLARTEELRVSKRRLATLRQNILGSIPSESAHRSCDPEKAKAGLSAGNLTSKCVRVSQVVFILKV